MNTKELFEEIEIMSKEIDEHYRVNPLTLYLINDKWQTLPEHMIVISK